MIVTIGRDCGSDGLEIGRRLARRLGIPCHEADGNGETEKAQFAAIQALADQGPCVLVGGCADLALAGREGLFRVFLHCEAGAGVRQAVEIDRYDLTVNSACLGIPGTVELLSQYVALNVMRRRREALELRDE